MSLPVRSVTSASRDRAPGAFRVYSPAFVERPLSERTDGLYVASCVCPVHHAHTYRNAAHHPYCRHRVSKRDSVAPVVGDERLRHAPYRAVPALEAQLKQVPERRRHIERRHKQESGNADANDILPPHHNLRKRKLRQHRCGKVLHLGDTCAKEQRSEYDVYEETRHAAHILHHIRWHVFATESE